MTFCRRKNSKSLPDLYRKLIAKKTDLHVLLVESVNQFEDYLVKHCPEIDEIDQDCWRQLNFASFSRPETYPEVLCGDHDQTMWESTNVFLEVCLRNWFVWVSFQCMRFQIDGREFKKTRLSIFFRWSNRSRKIDAETKNLGKLSLEWVSGWSYTIFK